MSRPWRSKVSVDRTPSAALALLRALRQQQGQPGDQPDSGNDADDRQAGPAALPIQGGTVPDVPAAGSGNDGEEEADGVDGDNAVFDEEEEYGGDEDEDVDVNSDDAFPDRTVEEDLLEIYSVHRLSRSAMDSIISLLNKHIAGMELPSFRAIKRSAERKGPSPRVRYVVDNISAGEEEFYDGCSIKRCHYTDMNNFQMRFVSVNVSVQELKDFHVLLHTNSTPPTRASICWDDVPVDRSSGRSLDVVMLKFDGCSNLYPLVIFHPLADVAHNIFACLEELLEQFAQADVTLTHVVADAPKRASIAGLKCHGGFYACFYCLIRGSKDRHAATCYPLCEQADDRTKQHYLDALDRPDFDDLVRREGAHSELLMGVKARSPLVDLNRFDIVDGLPNDCMQSVKQIQHQSSILILSFQVTLNVVLSGNRNTDAHMHLIRMDEATQTISFSNVHLGVVRRLLSKTFDCDGKKKAFPRKLMNIKHLNSAIRALKVPSEHSRRPRPYSPFWKASEYKTVIVFHFPVLLDVITLHHEDVEKMLLRDVWALLAYLVHVYSREKEDIIDLSLSPSVAIREFSVAFLRYLGRQEQTFNAHIFTHMQRVYDTYGPMHNVSAYAAEDSYQEVLACRAPGSVNVGKQSIENMLLRLGYKKHMCKRDIKLRECETARSQDNYIFTDNYKMYKITKVLEGPDQRYDAIEVTGEEFNYICRSGKVIKFNDIGVYKRPVAMQDRSEVINRAVIKGKVIVTKDYAVCCPSGLILEKCI